MRRLMVVDDEEIIRDIVQDIVDMNCHDIIVETACSGEEALARLRTNKYDLIFLDMKMKDCDGLETFRHMQEINPHQKVFIVTGYLDEERNKQAVKEGACGTLYKPFRVHDITQIIETHVTGQQPTGKA